MNLTKELICLNCGETMKQGGTSVDPYGMTQFRFCDNCGLSVFLFTEIKGFEYSLTRKPKDKILEG